MPLNSHVLHQVGEGPAVDPILNEGCSLSLRDKLPEAKSVLHTFLPRRLLF